MIELKDWLDKNAKRPLAGAIGSVVVLQFAYLTYLAHDQYSGQLRRIDRVVETASLGIQQSNRALIEATLIAGLQNSDASAVALCKGAETDILYPSNGGDPCAARSGGVFDWTVRRQAIGLAGNEFVFVIDRFHTFTSLAALCAIMMSLTLILWMILVRARRQFQSEILDPLTMGLNGEQPLNIQELETLRRKNLEFHNLSRKQAVSEALVQLSAQVAHDIRSPLAAMDSVLSDISLLPEKKRLIVRSAAGQIRDIANNLLEKNRAQAYRGPEETADARLLSSLIEAIITEKRLQYRSNIGIDISSRFDASSYGLFARVGSTDLKRVLSNLLNNAVESLGDKGRVAVRLSSRAGEILIDVEDDGKGIPPEILGRLGQRGETHGKTGGSGLGLHHAKTTLESWGGGLEIRSDAGKGATVTLRLPSTQAPDWFLTELRVEPESAVVFVDDDATIHQVWQGRFDSLRPAENKIDTLHFSTPAGLRAWLAENPGRSEGSVFLVDYEFLGDKETGLTVIEELGLRGRAVLVTSRFEEKDILDHCLRLKTRLLPKGLAGFVPIKVGQTAAVLIDDDKLVHMVWRLAAKSHGKTLTVFASPKEFAESARDMDKSAAIYVDSDLGEAGRGEEFAKELHSRGFTNLYLATGHPPESFPPMPWIKRVVGKEPPWG